MDMDVLSLIKSRESIAKVKDEEVPKEIIERLLEAAIWAPNRFLTEPWRFFILSGDGRKPLSRVLVEIAKEGIEDINSEESLKKLKKEEEKAFRAPIIIAVAAKVTNRDRVIPLEELGAVYAAIENILIMAQAEGLGAYWKTGTSIYHSKMKELFGLTEKDEILALIYIGYPEDHKKERKRTDFREKTRWINKDEKYF